MYKNTDKKDLSAASQGTSKHGSVLNSLTVIKRNQQSQIFSVDKIESLILRACIGLEADVEKSLILHELEKNIYSGITTQELEKALVLSAMPFIEIDPAYSKVTMRLLLASLYKEVFGSSSNEEMRELYYKQRFSDYIKKGMKRLT